MQSVLAFDSVRFAHIPLENMCEVYVCATARMLGSNMLNNGFLTCSLPSAKHLPTISHSDYYDIPQEDFE